MSHRAASQVLPQKGAATTQPHQSYAHLDLKPLVPPVALPSHLGNLLLGLLLLLTEETLVEFAALHLDLLGAVQMCSPALHC